MNASQDLTQGVIWKKLLMFFLPIAAGTLFQELYNAVDTLIVGRFVGTQALASVGGSASTVVNLLTNFFVALSSGSSVVIANAYGARDGKKVEQAVHSALLLSILIGLMLTAVIYPVCPALMRIQKVPADTLPGSILYLRIYYTGAVFQMLYNMGSGILQAVGNSRKPFLYLVISCVTNIILDIVFVVFLGWGVAGVAWATVIAQCVSSICVIRDLLKTKECYRLKPKKLRMNGFILKKMLRIGIPAGLQSSMYGISNLILHIGINILGTTVVASWAMSGKIDGIYWACVTALGTSVVNFIAQNHGAGRHDRIRSCTRTCFKIFPAATICLSGVIFLITNPLLHLFTTDTAVIATTWKIMIFFVPTYFIWTSIEIISSTLRGLGDAVRPAIIIGITVCLLRVIWVLTIFRLKPTLLSICLCYPVSWVLALFVLFLRFRHVLKMMPQDA